jgi:hypothetical protein
MTSDEFCGSLLDFPVSHVKLHLYVAKSKVLQSSSSSSLDLHKILISRTSTRTKSIRSDRLKAPLFETTKFLLRSDWTLAARGGACMKLHEIRCHFQEVSHRRARRDRRDELKFSFSAFSHRGAGHRPYGPEAANSAVNY